MNNQFVFDKKLKAITGAMIAIGVLCLALTYFTGEHSNIRFLTNLLHNSVFFVGIAFAASLWIAAHTMAWSGWHIIFKRIPEAMMMFMPFGAILMLIIGILVAVDFPGTEYLYLWSDETVLAGGAHEDELVMHKSAFLNTTNYLLTILVILIWTFFAAMMRKLSTQQDENSELRVKNLKKVRFFAATFLPIAGFSSAYAIWQWVMSVDAHWYSTLFAWYATISLWVSAISIMLLIAVFLKSRGMLSRFTEEHIHDLGKYIFGFTVFWTYLWFSQFLLIWYSNNGEETQYFFIRFEQFAPIFYLNLLINFVVPFFSLMMNSSKRTLGTVGFIAGLIVLGHWIDFYQMIKPGVWYTYTHNNPEARAAHGHGDDDHDHSEEHTNGDVYRMTPKDLNGGKATLTYFQGEHGDHNDHPADTTETHSGADSTNAVGHDHDGHDTHDHDGHDHDGHDHTDGHHGDDHGDGHEAGGHDGGDDHGGHHGPGFTMGIHFPGLLEFGTLLGFLGMFLFVTFTFLARASLYPSNDPYLGESEGHSVWPFGGHHGDDHH